MKVDKLTPQQLALLERIEREFPRGWFQASLLRAAPDDINALRSAGCLKQRLFVPQRAVSAYRLNPAWRS